MNLKELLAALQKELRDIQAKAEAEGRDFTDDELSTIDAKAKEAAGLKARIERAEKSRRDLAEITGGVSYIDDGDGEKARSLGEHFVKTVGAERLSRAKGVSGATVSAPEFKAATDTIATGGAGGALASLLVEVDTNIVRGPGDLTPVADLLGQGTLSVGSAIQFFVEGAIEGDVDMVAEGAAKPQLNIVNPTPEIAALKKVAGWSNVTDEYFDDLPLLASEINGRLIRRLARKVEQQVLNGNNTGAQLKGLLNTSGVQLLADIPAGALSLADAVLDATSMIENGTDGLVADAVVLNRADYVALRKAKDENGQYYGGGFFSGQYGNGTIVDGSTLWGGLRIAISPFISPGTALVGAFRDAATLYGKGGVQVDMSNSHADNFTTNKVTLRAEVRKALAARVPAGFVKITRVA